MRRASSLLELLVVIAVAAVLLGLLLAAVQKVRQTAMRMSCSNNVKQIALASHMVHDAENRLPSPSADGPGPGKFYHLGWLPLLLPYLEQDNIWQQVVEDYRTLTQPAPEGNPHRNVRTVLPILGCPADERTATAWQIPAVGRKKPIALTSYLGNSGTKINTRDGVIYKGARTQLLHITDGTSSTVLCGERPPSPDVIFGWWYGASGVAGTGVLDFTLNSREVPPTPIYPWYRHCPTGPYHFTPRTLDDYCGVYHYWSLHSGGANFGFCDGSVRFLRYEADNILPALMTRAGGEIVALD